MATVPKGSVQPAEIPSAVVPAPNTSHASVTSNDKMVVVEAVPAEDVIPIDQAATVFGVSTRTLYRKCIDMKELAVRDGKGRIKGVRRTVVEKLRYDFSKPTPAEHKDKIIAQITKRIVEHEDAHRGQRVPLPDPARLAVEMECSPRLVHEALVLLHQSRQYASQWRIEENKRFIAEQKSDADAIRAQIEADTLAEDLKRRNEEREADERLARLAQRPPIPLETEGSTAPSPPSTAAAE